MGSTQSIWIGNDHGGYDLKLALIEHLRSQGYQVHDVGSDSPELVPYPYYAAQVASAVSRGEAERGILICSTGIGMSIVANKFKGVRAAVCTNTYMGRMTSAHNRSNILCLGGEVTGKLHAIDIVDSWLDTTYLGGRHDVSLGLIADADRALCTGALWSRVRGERLEE